MASTSTDLTTTHRPTSAGFAAAGLAVAAIVVFAGNYHVPAGENGGPSEGVATGVICILAAFLLFGVVLPRVHNPDRSALVLGIITVLSLTVFWSGLTPVLTAATLAAANKTQTPRLRTTVIRWVAVGATVATVAWTLANSHLT
jgi:hypothetical protein